MTHIAQKELALYITGDLSRWRQSVVRLHVMSCRDCAQAAEEFRMDRAQVHLEAAQMPAGVEWNQLEAEMRANIHLGLSAGECVAPREQRTPIFKPDAGWAYQFFSQGLSRFSVSAWKPAAAVAGVTVLLAGAWWMNVPAADTESLLDKLRNIGRGVGNIDRFPQRVVLIDDRLPVVEVSAAGISVRENGGTLRMTQNGAQPLAISVSVEGKASAHYVDGDTGQVTVTSVYVE